MVIAMAAAASCSGYLDEDLKSSLAPDNTYTSSMGFETGCNGLYSIARSEYNTWGENGAYMHGAACAYEALQIATDIVDQNGAKDGSLTPFADLTLTAATKFVGSYWNWAYNLIASANEIMIYADKNTNWDYPEDKQIAIATARFFRAYAYRTLVYLYGDVPWVETIENPFKLSFTRTPKVEVLGHVIDDFTFAAENLPTDPDKVKTGKLTCWAAYHLLSEMYNFRGHLTKDKANFEEAAKCALKVIDSKYFALNTARFGASKNEKGDAFSDMFLENNQNRTSGNTESIWVMQFEYKTVGGGTNSDDWTRRAWNPQYFAINGFALADSLGGRGLAQISPMNGGSVRKIPVPHRFPAPRKEVSSRMATCVTRNTISRETGITTILWFLLRSERRVKLPTRPGLPASFSLPLPNSSSGSLTTSSFQVPTRTV